VRILYFADIRFPLERANGIQTMETCHALASRGHEVRLVVRPDTHAPPRDPFAYYGLTRLSRLIVERAPATGPQFARRLAYLSFAGGRAIGTDRADIIMTRDLGTAAILAKLPRTVRAPLVYESHGYAPDVAAARPEMITTAAPPGGARLKRLAKREAAVWRDADAYVTITAGLAALLAERFGPRARVAVVPDGVRLHVGREWDPVPRMEPAVVAYAGHLYPWKGVDVLLDAIARTPHVSGLIVGGHDADGDRARLESRAAQLGISRRVTFTGQVEPARVPEFLRRATILALPNPASAISTHFTSPLKLFEYMAAGRPIVASDLPAIREVLEHDTNALLVRPGDAAALADGVQRLVDDGELADRLARRAFADASEYTWERRAQRLGELFEEARTAR
jgi:glycosyltransferase involved in cell wall biosynthesis